jgi:hypothetical protein
MLWLSRNDTSAGMQQYFVRELHGIPRKCGGSYADLTCTAEEEAEAEAAAGAPLF